MYQQIFLPASKGLITSAPSSLIPNGAFSEVNNVRFGDGYVEKAQAFIDLKTIGDGTSPVLAINRFNRDIGNPINIVHTTNGLYNVHDDYTVWEEETEYIEDIRVLPSVPNGYCYQCIVGGTSGTVEPTWTTDETTTISDGGCTWVGRKLNLVKDPLYQVQEVGYIDSTTVFNQYFFCSFGTDIYYWDGSEEQAHKLEGTFNPDQWTLSTAYEVGDIVKPTTAHYSGYVYRCTQAGTSGATEPTWQQNMSTTVTDNECKWIGCGSDELEGNSANSLQAQCIDNYKGFLFVANTTEQGTAYPSRLRWSQWQNPRLWHNNEDGSGMSGYVDVDDTYGKIMAIRKLGDTLVVYKESGVITFNYTGGDTVFSKELITSQVGLLSPQAIVSLEHSHYFVGRDNIYMFDGNTVSPIGDSIYNYFFKDLVSVNKIIGYYDGNSKDILFAYSNENDVNAINLNKAIVYNIQTHTWSQRDMGITAIGDYSDNHDTIIDEITDSFDSKRMEKQLIDASLYEKQSVVTAIGTQEGKIYKLSGYADSRGDYEGYVVTKTHHMEDPLHIKRLLRIQFHIETQPNCNLYVIVKPYWDAEVIEARTDDLEEEWKDAIILPLNIRNSETEQPVSPPFVDVDLSARYFKIKFGTLKNNEYFKVLGYTLLYQTRGEI